MTISFGKAALVCIALLLPAMANAVDGQTDTKNRLEHVERDVSIIQATQAVRLEAVEKDTDKERQLAEQQRESLEQRIQAQDARIEDLGRSLDQFSVLALILGIVVTVLLVGIGIGSFFNARSEAQKKAAEWFNENEKGLLSRLAEIEKKVQSAAETVTQNIRQKEAQVTADLNAAQANFERREQPKQATTQALNTEAEAARSKPEQQYSAVDWDARAFDAYFTGKYEEAALYWSKAAQVEGAPSLQVARFLFNRAITLGQLGRTEEELKAYDEVLSRFGNTKEPDLFEQVAKALVNRGGTLGQLGRHAEALKAYDEVLSRFGNTTAAPLSEAVSRAMVGRGMALSDLGRKDEALNEYDEILRRFGGSEEIDLRERVARAMVYKGTTLGELERKDEALKIYDEILDRFGKDKEVGLREVIAMTLVNRGITFALLDRKDEALKNYDEVLSRFSDAKEAVLRERVAQALINRSITLTELGRNDDAIKCYDEVLSSFGNAQEVPLRKHLSAALNGKGFTYLLSAKKIWRQEQRYVELLKQAMEMFEKALIDDSTHWELLGNIGYAHFLLGEYPQAEKRLREALKKGGEKAFRAELVDAGLHPIPEDANFRVMLETLWKEINAKPSSPDKI